MKRIDKRIAIAAFAAALFFGANMQPAAAQNGNPAFSGLRMAANEFGQPDNGRPHRPPHEMRGPEGDQRPDFNRGDRQDKRPDFRMGERPEKRPDFNRGDRPDRRPGFNNRQCSHEIV